MTDVSLPVPTRTGTIAATPQPTQTVVPTVATAPTVPLNKENKQLILIVGETSTGKSASLRNIPNQQNWLYSNFESGKNLPFRNKFKKKSFTDPKELFDAFIYAHQAAHVEGVIVDSLTFMMEMYESVHVLTANNKLTGWGDFQQFFKTLMQQFVSVIPKTVIFTAHTKEQVDAYGNICRFVPVKGALKDNGIEAYFSTIVSTKRMRVSELEKYSTPLLVITPTERALGYKHVFQTLPTAQTVGERIRSPMGMWADNETYIDNDVQLVLTRLKEYYEEEV